MTPNICILTQLQESKKNPHPQFGLNWKVRNLLINFRYGNRLFFTFCNIFCNFYGFFPNSHKVATPEHFKLLFCISPLQKLYGYVFHLRTILQVHHAAATVKVWVVRG